MGGPAFNIPDQERINWLGYKAAAIRSFFSRNTDAFHRLTGVPHEEYHGYETFVSRHDFGSLIYRFGWWWLIILVLLVILVAVLLIRGDPGNENKSRNMEYLAISYLIRTGISCVLIVTMTLHAGSEFPFNALSLIDLLVLGVLLWDNWT